MHFNKENFEVNTYSYNGREIRYRAFMNRSYVDKPADPAFQIINIFVPECYYSGESINGYNLQNAPIFIPNSVGGYMPGPAMVPGPMLFGEAPINSLFFALEHGYVVASPGIRGRIWTYGKAPACIVDYKAAIRYLRHFKDEVPGDVNKIITNGTSAGGALSALMGVTGNHPDYEPYLEGIGAAKERDDIFAASCYCPIINLENADTAYEWQFNNVNEYHRINMEFNGDAPPTFIPEDGLLTDEQIQISDELKAMFPQYINKLSLKDNDGNSLSLDAYGTGSFLSYIESLLVDSADKAIKSGLDLSKETWLTIKDGKAIGVDFFQYAKQVTRMKVPPAFDNLSLEAPENELFGNKEYPARHFTQYGVFHSKVHGKIAEEKTISLLNPVAYVGSADTALAKHWRIRHGQADRDTSLAISAILVLKLKEAGRKVDYALPWGIPHSGDYDLEELFAWIDKICLT
ncbi:MAG: alpha/beta hydrolase [Lachnospiraceae bacterium]|jgi:acetyl esterase/lipase|nr:alpha/beta hydrolase [Lachnospiraceae bacterium]